MERERLSLPTYDSGNPEDDYNNWQVRTTITRPDNSQEIVYSNHVGQELLSDLSDSAGPGRWIEFRKYDDHARVTEVYTPSVIDMSVTPPYTDTADQLVVSAKTGDGLIRITEYVESGDGEGYPEYELVKKGTGEPRVGVRAFTYKTHSINAGTPAAATVVVPWQVVEFRSDVLGGTDPVATREYDFVFYDTAHGHSSDTTQVKTRTTTLPAVPSTENSNLPTGTMVEQFDIQGQLTSTTDPRNIVTTFTYYPNEGARKQMVEDSGGENLTTDYQVDTLGRTTQVLGPAHDAVFRNTDGTYTIHTEARRGVLDCVPRLRARGDDRVGVHLERRNPAYAEPSRTGEPNNDHQVRP